MVILLLFRRTRQSGSGVNEGAHSKLKLLCELEGHELGFESGREV